MRHSTRHRFWLSSCPHLAAAMARADGPAGRIYALTDDEVAERSAVLDAGGRLGPREAVELAIAMAARDPESAIATLRLVERRLRRPQGPAALQTLQFARRVLRLLIGTTHRLQRGGPV